MNLSLSTAAKLTHAVDPLPDPAGTSVPAIDRLFTEADVIGVGTTVREARSLVEAGRFVHGLVVEGVERRDVRIVALEERPAAAAALDLYVRHGRGRLPDVIAALWAPWQTVEFVGLVEDLRRGVVAGRPAPLLVGVDAADDSVSDAVDEGFARAIAEARATVEGRILYLGGAVHVAAAPLVVQARRARSRRGPAGHRLRLALGDRYRAAVLAFGQDAAGEVLAAPHPSLLEATLQGVARDALVLDLRRDDAPVRELAAGAARLRAVGPAYDPADDGAHRLEVSVLRDAFDVLVYWRRVRPTRPSGT
jgi:erythromycin esterase